MPKQRGGSHRDDAGSALATGFREQGPQRVHGPLRRAQINVARDDAEQLFALEIASTGSAPKTSSPPRKILACDSLG
jgi:hypothetical protein